jgi:hypothetical protein
LSEKGDLFSRVLKNKDCKEEKMMKVEWYISGESTTLESNKSLQPYAVLWTFREPSLGRHVRRELRRNAWLDFAP